MMGATYNFYDAINLELWLLIFIKIIGLLIITILIRALIHRQKKRAKDKSLSDFIREFKRRIRNLAKNRSEMINADPKHKFADKWKGRIDGYADCLEMIDVIAKGKEVDV